MKPFVWRWLAVSSLLVGLAANAETRPQYGGTLRVAMRAAPTSLDPADAQPDSFGRRSLAMLMFDTLVAIDENGRVQASLALTWQASAGNRRWQFRLRHGVKFHDGTPLTAEIAAASLRTGNPSWKVSAGADSVVIETEGPDPELLAELALPRNSIVKRDADGKPEGTGPFYVEDWQPGKKLTLAAEEAYWRGRPFLDCVEIEMGKSYRDQMMALELGRSDLVEVAAEQVHRVSLEGRKLASSAPVELLALVFARDAQTPDERLLREALALSVDRGSIRSVILQGAGQAAGGLLPNWISGYGFVFPTDADLPRARHDLDQVRNPPGWALAYDGNDSMSRVLAERIALNAKDAGISLKPTTSSAADLQLERIPLASVDPWVTLATLTAAGGLPIKSSGGPVEDLYAAEETALATERIIPLFHLPVSYAAVTTLKDWSVRPDGAWNLADAWLGSGKP